jgi:hypothetical protein
MPNAALRAAANQPVRGVDRSGECLDAESFLRIATSMWVRILPEPPYNCNCVKLDQPRIAAAGMGLLLAALVLLPFALQGFSGGAEGVEPRAQATADEEGANREAGDGEADDGVLTPGQSRKGTHGHDLAPEAAHWYLTVHGTGEFADVFALDATGRVIGGVLAKPPAGPDELRELRGIKLLGDGRLAVVNAYMKSSRVLLFGPATAEGMLPFAGVWAVEAPSNPGLVHPYQIVTAPDGTLYVSNQDTNTVTRYRGLGTPQAGQPLPLPSGLREFGTLPPGAVVPNSQHSPEGIHEVRGIAFGPDGLLYVADRGANRVVAFSTETGRRERVVFDRADGLGRPIQLLFTPDGLSLLVGDNLNHCVWSVDLESGKARHLVAPRAGGLNAPSALAIDGSRLLVGSREGKQILSYRLSNGEFVGVFARLQSNPEFLIPTQQK